MNPDTNKFEKLSELQDDIERQIDEAMGKVNPKLLRPDGTPVPKSWTIFTVGELVVIKNYSFKVVHIGESHILFEPVSIEEVSKIDKVNKKNRSYP